MSVTSSIIPVVEQLESQNSQSFTFSNVEKFLKETRTSEICDALGVSADLVNRYRESGLDAFEADEVACKLHEHVGTIWPEWFDVRQVRDDIMDKVEEFRSTFKKCGKCKQWVALKGGFYKRTASKDGYARFCKDCTKQYDLKKKSNDDSQ